MLTKSEYDRFELTRILLGIIAAVLMAWGLSHFFEYDFGFWPWFVFIIGFYLFPKVSPKHSIDWFIKRSELR